MAYLNKKQYDYRRESAAKRFSENSEIATQNGCTQEQIEALEHLTRMRHDLHSNIDKLIQDNSMAYKGIIAVNEELCQSGLERMTFAPISNEDADLFIDDFNLLFEIDEVPSDEEERQDWYDENYSRLYNEWEQLNTKIENYLKIIDGKYKTNFCPSGALRVF